MLNSFLKLFFGSLFGKIVAFLRELIVAFFYGTGYVISGFRIAQGAFIIPTHFFTLDILNAGFIPLYSRYKKEGEEKAQSLFWLFQISLLILSLILMGVLYYFSYGWIKFVAPGFKISEIDLIVEFFHILVMGIPFYIFSSFYSYMGVANGIYLLASIKPIIHSLGIISGTVASYFLGDLKLLAWGFTSAYFIFFLIATFELFRYNLLKLYFNGVAPIIDELIKIIKPLLILPFLSYGSLLVEKIVSSFMGGCVVAAVDYAKFVTESGLMLLAIPLGLIGLTQLSTISYNDAKDKLKDLIEILLLITIPISLSIFIYAKEIVSILFERGAFNKESVEVTKSVLEGFAVGFWAQVISYVLIKGLNAQHKNREVAIFIGATFIVNIAFNLLFYKTLGAITIGLAISLSSIILFISLIVYLNLFLIGIKLTLLLLSSSLLFYIVDFFILKELNIFFSISIFTLYWIAIFYYVPALRSLSIDIIKKFKGRGK